MTKFLLGILTGIILAMLAYNYANSQVPEIETEINYILNIKEDESLAEKCARAHSTLERGQRLIDEGKNFHSMNMDKFEILQEKLEQAIKEKCGDSKYTTM